LAMLLLLVLLGVFTGYSAVWSTCTTRRIGVAQQVQQLFSDLQQVAAVILPRVTLRAQRSGWLSSWRVPALGWCVVKAVGERQQQPVAIGSCTAVGLGVNSVQHVSRRQEVQG
jgi:hypothetical protein